MNFKLEGLNVSDVNKVKGSVSMSYEKLICASIFAGVWLGILLAIVLEA